MVIPRNIQTALSSRVSLNLVSAASDQYRYDQQHFHESGQQIVYQKTIERHNN